MQSVPLEVAIATARGLAAILAQAGGSRTLVPRTPGRSALSVAGIPIHHLDVRDSDEKGGVTCSSTS